MTDEPTTCAPPDPSVSGWWWLAINGAGPQASYWNSGTSVWWSDFIMSAKVASLRGYRVLGPVPTHSEVEALQTGLEMLHAESQQSLDLFREVSAKLTAANAEIARLKSPALVTVHREDLRICVDAVIRADFDTQTAEEFENLVATQLTSMEAAAR